MGSKDHYKAQEQSEPSQGSIPKHENTETKKRLAGLNKRISRLKGKMKAEIRKFKEDQKNGRHADNSRRIRLLRDLAWKLEQAEWQRDEALRKLGKIAKNQASKPSGKKNPNTRKLMTNTGGRLQKQRAKHQTGKPRFYSG